MLIHTCVVLNCQQYDIINHNMTLTEVNAYNIKFYFVSFSHLAPHFINDSAIQNYIDSAISFTPACRYIIKLFCLMIQKLLCLLRST